MSTNKNHNHPHFKHLREVVLWLHDYKCFVTDKYHPNLEVHHIDKNSANHSLLNLIPVTPEIHKYLSKTPPIDYLTKNIIRKKLQAKINKYYK